MINNDLTPHILRRAYEIWENEGRPQGRDKAHWFLAEAEVSNGAPPAIAEPSTPKRKPRSAATSTRTAKRR
jgi:hypothetical protein